MNGVWCSSAIHFTLSNDNSNLDDIEVSEYCFISKPLHFVGPVSENVPNTKTPSALIPFSAIETYLFIFYLLLENERLHDHAKNHIEQ